MKISTHFIQASIALLLTTVGYETLQADEAKALQETRQPNILLILLDNVGKDWFRCYGSQENVTPHIDELARTGVKYRNFYATPVCSTSRVQLLTGRYPFRTGWHTHHDPAIYGGGYFDWKREISIARVLKDAGYRTYISGKWQINDLFDPEQKEALYQHGFDEYCIFPEGKKGHPAHKKRYWDPYVIENGRKLDTEGEYGPDLFTGRLIDFMADAAKDKDTPFFAYYPAILTHIAIGSTPDNKDQSLSDRELFAGMVEYADKLIGKMTTALDELNLRDNTIILLATDNGTDDGSYHGYENLAGHVAGRKAAIGSTMKPKENGYYRLNEWVINMPFIVNCPKLIPGGRESDDLVDLSDLFPTIADFAHAEIPANRKIDGRSLAPRLVNETSTAPWRPWCFTQYHKIRVIRDQRFKLMSDGTFYDLSEDPLERHDLNKSPRLNEDTATREAHDRLSRILDGFPEDAELPWEFRSISARQLGAGKENRP